MLVSIGLVMTALSAIFMHIWRHEDPFGFMLSRYTYVVVATLWMGIFLFTLGVAKFLWEHV